MNIESTSTATLTKTAEASTNSSNNVSSAKEDTKSFKEELETVKTQDTKTEQTEEAKAAEETQSAAETEAANNQINNKQVENNQKTAENNLTQNVEKNKLTKSEDKTAADNENSKISDPLNKLSAEIEVLNSLKNGANQKTQASQAKTGETSKKDDYCKVLKMNNNDIAFFVNLVDNQQMTAQAGQNIQSAKADGSTVNFTEIKTEAAQQTIPVSQALLDALNESVKTNKPFRIDFDKDIAVIMKVDKDGNLSANFIPGSAAVETYLKNNIAGLQQSFDNQNLPYNELTYSKQQNQEQQGRDQKKNKENEDE